MSFPQFLDCNWSIELMVNCDLIERAPKFPSISCSQYHIRRKTLDLLYNCYSAGLYKPHECTKL